MQAPSIEAAAIAETATAARFDRNAFRFTEFNNSSPSFSHVRGLPRGAKPGKYPDKIKVLNGLYEQAFAGNPQITFCDTWSLFDAGDGQCRKGEFPDMLHPNTAGYAKWTEALRPIFAKLKL